MAKIVGPQSIEDVVDVLAQGQAENLRWDLSAMWRQHSFAYISRVIGLLQQGYTKAPQCSPQLHQYDVDSAERVLFEKATNGEQTQICLVIPHFKQENFLLQTLDRIAQVAQGFALQVIVVDDGSDDQTRQRIIAKLKSIPAQSLCLGVDRDDFKNSLNFRAGTIRNIGAKYCQAMKILFLDSDILIDKNFLQEVCELKEDEVLMGKRLEKFKYGWAAINCHWHNFYQNGNSWMQLKVPWKYICSHSLAMSLNAFRDSQGFDTGFTTWGYEDVELGYRLYQKKFNFKLSSSSVYHLNPPVLGWARLKKEMKQRKNLREGNVRYLSLCLDVEAYRAQAYLYKWWTFFAWCIQDIFYILSLFRTPNEQGEI